MTKPNLEMLDLGGIPIPGQYSDLKGIELWGDGKVFGDGEKKEKKTKRVHSDLAANIAKKGLEHPIFVEHGEVMTYDEFIASQGDIIDAESYQLITEVYASIPHDIVEETYIYQFMEGAGENIFFDRWYPIILDNMKKSSSQKQVHDLIEEFVDNNAKALSLRYPSTNIMMPQNTIDRLIRIAGFSNDEMKEAVTTLLSSLDAKTDFKSISKSPHQVIFAAMLIAAIELKEEKLKNDMVTFVAFSMYPLIFRKYFPVTDPNPYAMEEVVMTASKKFYIAKTNSLLEWVRILTTVPTDFYQEQFEKSNKNDKLIVLYLNRLRNTMNQQFKSLYGVYKKAYDKRSLSRQSDEDFITLGSNQDKVHIYTMSIVDRINGMRFNAKICKAAAEYTKTDENEVAKYVKEFLRDTAEYRLQEFVTNLLTIYFAVGQHNEFLSVAIKQYNRIFASKDKMYNDFRNYLERIEKKFSDFDGTYIHRYLFSVYMYFAILVNIGMNQISNKLVDINATNAGAVSQNQNSVQKEDI